MNKVSTCREALYVFCPSYSRYFSQPSVIQPRWLQPIEKGREGLEYAHGKIHHWEFEKEVLEGVPKELP